MLRSSRRIPTVKVQIKMVCTDLHVILIVVKLTGKENCLQKLSLNQEGKPTFWFHEV